jgi:hypothetical protein
MSEQEQEQKLVKNKISNTYDIVSSTGKVLMYYIDDAIVINSDDEVTFIELSSIFEIVQDCEGCDINCKNVTNSKNRNICINISFEIVQKFIELNRYKNITSNEDLKEFKSMILALHDKFNAFVPQLKDRNVSLD